jgi:hypothetical protein
MSSSTVSVWENNQVEIRRTFSAAFLLAKKYGKPPVIRGYEPGQPTMEIMPASEIGQKLLALGLVWQWRLLPLCPYCRREMGTALSFRNYLQRSGFNPAAALNECTACGAQLSAPVPLFEKVSPGDAASRSDAEEAA